MLDTSSGERQKEKQKQQQLKNKAKLHSFLYAEHVEQM